QTISDGCQDIDAFNAINIPGTMRTLEFFENEQITIASLTVTTGPPPDGFNLFVDGSLVDTTSFPGSVTWTAPADGIYEIRFFVFTSTGGVIFGLNYEGECRLLGEGTSETAEGINDPCPFNDGRINNCDTFNPVVLYPINTENGTRLDIYNADGSGLIISLPADLISANTACPAENTAILIDTTNDIVFYLLSSCEYYLHAPMNEPGKYYIIIFDDLNSGTYYESRTEFFDF
ncbi:MAG: hypothetical protein AAFR81_18070, partial [Chloroflexota bacterium]